MTAAYQATTQMTDDESFGFAIAIQNAGVSLPLDEYEFEYVVIGCGENLKLDQTNGVSVDLNDSLVVVEPGPDRRLRPGLYSQGFRAKHITSGKVVQLFDGTITVSEGNFR